MDHSSPRGIVWPHRYAPANAPVYVRNELAMPDVPASAAWAWLIRAPRWPEWYPNAANVRVPGDRDLALGTNFRWKTFGVTISSTVREFVPNERIAWDAQAFGLDVYHAWLIERRSTGCWVLPKRPSMDFWRD